jgi:hypothetical protein
MANFVANIVKGKPRYYLELPAANDGLFLVLLKFTGLEADATLRDYDDLAAVLAAANDEADFTGYSRKAVTPGAATVDDTNERVDIDAPDVSAYTNSGGASQRTGKAVLCYDPDTTAGTDSTLVPILWWDCDITFDVGVATTLPFNVAGILRAED